MIVRETGHAFIMIAQHDHALLSGRMAAHFSGNMMKSDAWDREFLLAVSEHDRSWVRLDDIPIWNDRSRAPYSFIDYPLLPKLTHYSYGLDELESGSKYACLLVSMHYASFFMDTDQEDGKRFRTAELARQQRLLAALDQPDSSIVHRRFRLLQFCDRLSLYACLNEPGADKESEHPWYRNGFPDSEDFAPDRHAIIAHWKNPHEIIVHPYPFEGDFSATLRRKVVSKELVRQLGIGEAYRQTEPEEQVIAFGSEGQ